MPQYFSYFTLVWVPTCYYSCSEILTKRCISFSTVSHHNCFSPHLWTVTMVIRNIHQRTLLLFPLCEWKKKSGIKYSGTFPKTSIFSYKSQKLGRGGDWPMASMCWTCFYPKRESNSPSRGPTCCEKQTGALPPCPCQRRNCCQEGANSKRVSLFHLHPMTNWALFGGLMWDIIIILKSCQFWLGIEKPSHFENHLQLPFFRLCGYFSCCSPPLGSVH